MPNFTTLEQVEALNNLKAALDAYNMLVLGIVEGGDLVEAREEQVDAVDAAAQAFMTRD